jgi:hypothetical protein
MAEIATGWGCPKCRELNMTQMLFNEQFSTKGYYCRNGHDFKDMGELKAMNPAKLQVPQKTTIQQGYEEVKMSIPSDLKAALLAKFGNAERLAATLSAVFRSLSQEKCFIVGLEDIEKLVEHSGIEVNSSAQLVGAFFAMRKQIQDLIQESKVPANNGNGSSSPVLGPGKLVIDIQDHMPKLLPLCKFRNESPENICEGAIRAALDGGYA